MRNKHHSKILPLLLVIITISLYSCKSGMHSKSVFGGKKSSGKNIFQRYQSRDFQAKKYDKTKVISDQEEGDHTLTPPPVSSVPDQKSLKDAQNTESSVITAPTSLNHTEVPLSENSSDMLTETEVNSLSSASTDANIPSPTEETETAPDNYTNESAAAIRSTINQAAAIAGSIEIPYQYLSKKVQIADFRTSLKELHLKAEKKGKSYLWILYFAIAQGFTGLILGFKHIFQMLDSPFDAGNKSLGISYAATAILAIHAMLLIGLVKNFM